MGNKEEVLKAIRENLTEEDLTKLGYSKHYIYSILIGRREKLNVLLECSEIAVKNMYAKIVLLNDFNLEMEGNEITKFAKMTYHDQLNVICKMKNLKQINSLKKDLVKLGVFEKLSEEAKALFYNLTIPKLNELRLRRFLNK
jgi:hypothetical protein